MLDWIVLSTKLLGIVPKCMHAIIIDVAMSPKNESLNAASYLIGSYRAQSSQGCITSYVHQCLIGLVSSTIFHWISIEHNVLKDV
jgi:hypothetical protein